MGMEIVKTSKSGARKKGKKNRKWGRAARKPAHKRYNTEERWKKNKAKKIARQEKKDGKAKDRKDRRG